MQEFWISLSYATFGVSAANGVVIEAAPIAKWTVGKSLSRVLSYYRSKGAKVVEIL